MLAALFTAPKRLSAGLGVYIADDTQERPRSTNLLLAELPVKMGHIRRAIPTFLAREKLFGEKCPLRGNNVMLNSVLKQFGIGLNAQALHHFVLVKRDGSRFHLQHTGDFLH